MLKIPGARIQALIEGGLSFVPGCSRLFKKGTRGTDSARYCYSVWMRHFVKINKFKNGYLGTVVELGPGDSLGTGLASLLCGAERYYAVDAVEHANPDLDLQILKELISIFRIGASIPDQLELPDVRPLLDDYAFPDYAPRDLGGHRYDDLARAVLQRNSRSSVVRYVRTDDAQTNIPAESVDLIFSQAVLEHVDGLESVYASCYKWLKPGGLMSHQIDFKSHGTSSEWNGHWAYPAPVWRLIRGNRRYLLNRQPCGVHLRALKHAGFSVIAEERARLPSLLQRSRLNGSLRDMPEDDLTTSGVFLIARKPASGEYQAEGKFSARAGQISSSYAVENSAHSD
jgi:SAM-dependent methyltransferase